MKIFLLLIAFVMTVGTSFAQVDALSSIGWRKGVLNTYCDEYDLMPDEGKQWILPWNATKEIVKYALIRDGYKVEETDSTISWNYQTFLKFEIQFTEDLQIKNVGTIIIVKPVSGIQIAETLKKKLESIYAEKGKFRSSDGSSISYTWLSTNCNKNVVTMLSRNMIDKNNYLVTQYSSQLK